MMVERKLLVLIAVLAGFGLSGCISGGGGYSQTASIQQPSQEILDGTIRNPADWSDAPSPSVPRRSAKVTIGVAKVTDGQSAAPAEAPKVFSAEWWAKENLENERLKGRMHICRGC